MTKGQKFLTGLLTLAFIALVVWVTTSIPDAPPKEEEHKDEKRVMSYEGNTLTSEKNGKRQWLLKAEKMSVDVDTQDAQMEGIEVEVYNEDGSSSHITAPKGFYFHKDKIFGVEGGTKVITADKAELTSNKLYWISKEDMLVAEGDAKLKKDNFRASGDRMESKNGFSLFRILGKAHIDKGVKDENK